jgi:hypothetical protein
MMQCFHSNQPTIDRPEPRHVPSPPARANFQFHFTRPRVFRQTRATPSTQHKLQLANHHKAHNPRTKQKAHSPAIMSEATPRITAPYLEQFSHQTVRILGKVRQLRGETATIDAGGQISVFLTRVCS